MILPRRRFTFGLIAVLLLALAMWFGFNRSGVDSPGTQTATGFAPRKTSTAAVGVENALSRSGARTASGGPADEWNVRWRKLMEEPETMARDEDMATFFEELAATDPLRAISWADGEPDSELRLKLLQAALRGWGAANPDAAVAWSDSQTLVDSGQAIAAVFQGVARDVEKAVNLAAKLSAADPARIRDYGSYLVAALSEVGEFSAAAAFAAKGTADIQTDWINLAYSRWAESEPEVVMEQIAHLSDPGTQRTAFDAAISRWAKNDARAAAEYALTLSGERERRLALSLALRSWSAADASQAAGWMNRFEPSPELDFGIAVIASQPEALHQPQVAAGWAESIVDPRLRVRVLASIVKEWAAIDIAAARQYAEHSPNIRAEDRAGVLSAFEPGFNPVSLLP